MGRNMERTHIWVIGGDQRQSILAGLLRDDGHRVHTLGLGEEEAEGPDLDGIGEAHCVILPLPAQQPEGWVYTPLSPLRLSVEQVLEHVSGCSSETILCGDFNDTPMSYTYQRLIRGHKDTFCEAGNGFGSTYRILWPALRIDYIFIPDGYSALSHASPRIRYSDHYPVIAEFAVSQDAEVHNDNL